MQDKLSADLKAAMLARDQRTVDVLRFVKSALQNEQIALGHELSDEEVTKVLRRETKKRSEAAELYVQGGNQERAAAEQQELEIINRYLPQAMSEEELSQLVDAVVAELGDVHPGQIIQTVLKKATGRADGSVVARLVSERRG